METIEEYEKRRFQEIQDSKFIKGSRTGISCSNCSSEMINVDSKLILTNPPKMMVVCPKCGYKTVVLA